MDYGTMLDASFGSVPTLIVPDDPVNGAIEKPRTPPPVEIDVSRLPPPVVVSDKPRAADMSEHDVDNDTPYMTAADDPSSVPATPDAPAHIAIEMLLSATDLETAQCELQEPSAGGDYTKKDDTLAAATVNATAPLSQRWTPRIQCGDGDAFEIAISPNEDDPKTAAPNDTTDPINTISSAPATTLPLETATVPTTEAPMVLAPAISSKDNAAMAKRARALAKLDRLAAGNKSIFEADMNDIGALGIGMQLYFMFTKYLSVTFAIMGIVSLPAIVVNYYGNGVTAKLVDPLQLAYASLGNQGVSEDMASDPRQCLPKGAVDCTGATVNTPFTTDPVTVAWIVTISDCVYSVVFVVFILVYRHRALDAIEHHATENLTPAKYAVYVRGFPRDATTTEILSHFNALYDPTQRDEYFPLYWSCCWGRRRKVGKTLDALTAHLVPTNMSVVTNVDHLAAATATLSTDDKRAMYLHTWIAEVSVAHPTGGLLRTFLRMEALTKGIAETQELVDVLALEKATSDPRTKKTAFRAADERLLQRATAKLTALHAALATKTSKIKVLQQTAGTTATAPSAMRVFGTTNKVAPTSSASTAKHVAATTVAAAARTVAAPAFNWTACECAFVVFNNLESRRRCLRDYRKSSWFFPRRYQPALLRFRNGKWPLTVTPAPEPSNILWENLEVTSTERFARRSLTNCVTLVLLFISGAIISAAQSAQATFKAKMPPTGLCENKLPQVFYGNASFNANARVAWRLAWDANATCAPGPANETRFHIAYTNRIINDVVVHGAVDATASGAPPRRCIDPCVADTSSDVCSTLPCFDSRRRDAGDVCETYLASHVLYCYCTTALTTSVAAHGVLDGAKALWESNVPCRGFVTDYVTKNAFILLAASVVVVVNVLLKATLRAFAAFERHASESSKASALAVKLCCAQVLNTAVIVLLVNASIGGRSSRTVSSSSTDADASTSSSTNVLQALLQGKYSDFVREWYPTVGMGIATTMVLNAVVPPLLTFVQLAVLAPLRRCIARRAVRTQSQMTQLFAGPAFDLSSRYPLVLTSVVVTMAFSGGSPVLLFIAAAAAAITFSLDKLALLHWCCVTTTYDEALGVVALALLPWTLVIHLAFSTWMYGNPALLASPTLDIRAALARVGLSVAASNTTTAPATNDSSAACNATDMSSSVVINAVLHKLEHATAATMFVGCVVAIAGIVVSTLWLQLLLPLLQRSLGVVLAKLWRCVARVLVRFYGLCRCCSCCRNRQSGSKQSATVAVDATSSSSSVPLPPLAVDTTDAGATDASSHPQLILKSFEPPAPVQRVLPEFTAPFCKSIPRHFRPDARLGFARNAHNDLVRLWLDDTVVDGGIVRRKGDAMRTWEAMRAPVAIYAIDANAKYKVAVHEMTAAAATAVRQRAASVAMQAGAVVDAVATTAAVDAAGNAPSDTFDTTNAS